jgi:LAO/AO transport system kinase
LSALDRCWSAASPAYVVGISGPSGVGKSVLTGRLLHAAIEHGTRTAALLVDPSSPYSGGAVLGDRMRLQALGVPAGAFVRSLASRGALGGLSVVVPASIRALETAGYELVLIETVGVGQNETDIVSVADTVIVVQAPGAGDEIQGLKAGLLEIADVFVLNKSELAGADQAVAVLQDVARPGSRGRRPAVVRTSAISGAGIAELWRAIQEHHDWLTARGQKSTRRRLRLQAELRAAASAALTARMNELALAERFSEGTLTLQEALASLFGNRDPSALADKGASKETRHEQGD